MKSIVIKLLLFLTVFLAGYFLWQHYQLALVRYFDVDEFAHLHWAGQIFQGQRPYLDFFIMVPPGFWWFLQPLFNISQDAVQIVISARVLIFALFAAIAASAGYLFYLNRRSWLAFTVPLFLAFLPLPFDKFLEVRPDNLAILLVIWGLILEIRYFQSFKKSYLFLSGIVFGLSIVVLPKFIPQVALCLLFALFFCWTQKKSHYWFMLFGFGGVLLIFFVWLLSLGNFQLVFYSLAKLPFESYRISQTFIMMPDLFFYPNEIFYGMAGLNQVLYFNHALWLLGLLVALYRLVTPYLVKEKRQVYSELLLSLFCFLSIVLYVKFVPLKHTQYLIPIAIFVAYFAADGLYLLWERLKSKLLGQILFGIIYFGMLFIIFIIGTKSYVPKLGWSNKQDLNDLARASRLIPPGAYVFDLDGRMFMYKDPYYVCCMPFGQYEGYLSVKLPSLTKALAESKTNYIYEGYLNRIKSLNYNDQAYIYQNFQLSRDIPHLWVRSEK